MGYQTKLVASRNTIRAVHGDQKRRNSLLAGLEDPRHLPAVPDGLVSSLCRHVGGYAGFAGEHPAIVV